MDIKDITDIMDVTDITDVTDIMDVTDVTDVTDITDVAGVSDVTDITDVAGVKDFTDVAGVTDVTDITGRCGSFGHYGVAGVMDITDVADVTDVTDITDVAGVTDFTDITGGTVRHMAYLCPGLSGTHSPTALLTQALRTLQELRTSRILWEVLSDIWPTYARASVVLTPRPHFSCSGHTFTSFFWHLPKTHCARSRPGPGKTLYQ